MMQMKRLISLVCTSVLLIAVPVQAQVLGANDQPIHDVARVGNGQDVTVILKAQPAARDVRAAQGSTPLHLAATNPDISALKALLAAGADPNARDGEGATPLHMAAYTQNAKHSQLLLEAGADPGSAGGPPSAALLWAQTVGSIPRPAPSSRAASERPLALRSITSGI